MVDSVVNQEPADLQAILYSKSLPVLANMLAPELKEGKANNYKVVGVERARGFSIVTIKITKSAEVDIDEATEDQVREVTVDYEHHNLQAVLEHFLGKGELAVAAIPTSLDDVNELILEKTDKLILDEADIQAYFSGNIVDLYVKDPLDLRWYGNARLTFKEVEGGAPEEPGKPETTISEVTYDYTVGLLNAKVTDATEVTVSTSTGINVVRPIENETLRYFFEPILPGGTTISIDTHDKHAEIKTPSELVDVAFNHTTKLLTGRIIGDVRTFPLTTSYGYTGTVNAAGDGTVSHTLADAPATAFDISYVISDLSITTPIAEAKPTSVTVTGIPADVTVGDVLNYTIALAPAGITQTYNVVADAAKCTVDKANKRITILAAGTFNIEFVAVADNTVKQTITVNSKPALASIAFTTVAEQTHTAGELSVALAVAGSPVGAVVPNVVYTITESSEDVVAVITGGNTLEATAVVAGSTIKVKAAVTVNGNEISTEQTFTVSD